MERPSSQLWHSVCRSEGRSCLQVSIVALPKSPIAEALVSLIPEQCKLSQGSIASSDGG
jgi:hypothetical protein